MRKLVWLMLRGYQLFVSPMLGSHCRYYPSCSQYAIDAIEDYGVLHGGWFALRRLLRCHPWHAGGFDPVPTRRPSLTPASSAPDGPIVPTTCCAEPAGHSLIQPSSAHQNG